MCVHVQIVCTNPAKERLAMKDMAQHCFHQNKVSEVPHSSAIPCDFIHLRFEWLDASNITSQKRGDHSHDAHLAQWWLHPCRFALHRMPEDRSASMSRVSMQSTTSLHLAFQRALALAFATMEGSTGRGAQRSHIWMISGRGSRGRDKKRAWQWGISQRILCWK